ncbi:hypothetical protein [Arcobacter aquimarinus]|uniref:hypothetical protein n=1 Tax=Arcobacter aquimarinus TaxID=1315211 RepID=UPI003BB182DA
MIENLYKNLEIFYNKVQKPFAGIGLVISDKIEGLPIHSVYNSNPSFENETLVDILIKLSNYNNYYHDGFHVLSSNLEIKCISQYFFPVPPKELHLEINNNTGVRYLVAKIGSLHPNIICTAIISDNYGISIFKDGVEVKAKKYD